MLRSLEGEPWPESVPTIVVIFRLETLWWCHVINVIIVMAGGGGQTDQASSSIIEIVILLIITLNTLTTTRPLLLDDIDIHVANNTNNNFCLHGGYENYHSHRILKFSGEQMYVGNLLPADHDPPDRFAATQIFGIN